MRGPTHNPAPSVPPEMLARYAPKHPQLAHLARVLTQCGEPQDPDLVAAFLTMVKQYEAVGVASGDAFWPNNPGAGCLPSMPGDIRVLDTRSGNTLSIPFSRLFEGVAVIGPTGTGKTRVSWRIALQAALHGATVIVADRKTEARSFLGHPKLRPLTTVLDASNLQLSMYEPIPGVRMETVTAETTNVIGACMGKLVAHDLVPEAVASLRRAGDIGVDDGAPLPLLMHAINAIRSPSRRTAELKDSIQRGLRTLDSHLGPALNYRRTDMVEKMASGPSVFVLELPALPPNVYSFVLLQIILRLFLRHGAIPVDQRRPVILLLDDATFAVSERGEKSHASGISPLSNFMLLTRERRIGFIIVCHTLSGLSETIRQNVHSFVFSGSRGDDPFLLKRVLGINEAQYEQMRVLQPGEAVGFVPSQWPHALMGHLPDIQLPAVTNDACQASAERFLATVSAVPGPDIQAHDESPGQQQRPGDTPETRGGLAPEAVQVLTAVNQPVPAPTHKIAEQCGFSRDKTNRIIRDLENAGLVRSTQVPTGRRGAPYRLITLTDIAITFMRDHGIRPVEMKLHGSHLHSGAGEAAAAIARAQGYAVQFEVAVGDRRVDLRCREQSNGSLLFIQIGISDPAREARAAIDILRAGNDQTWIVRIVCLNRSFQDTVQAETQAADMSPTQHARVQTQLLGEVLTEWYAQQK